MTFAEDEKRGVLTVDLDLVQIGQDIKNVRHFLDRLEAHLEKAAADRKFEAISANSLKKN